MVLIKSYINLNILECKYRIRGYKAFGGEYINLNILECKCGLLKTQKLLIRY